MFSVLVGDRNDIQLEKLQKLPRLGNTCFPSTPLPSLPSPFGLSQEDVQGLEQMEMESQEGNRLIKVHLEGRLINQCVYVCFIVV